VLLKLWGNEELGGLLKFGAPLAAILVVDKLFKFDALMALLTPVILIGGMASGLFTPTEAAVAAVFWALFLGFVWYRTLNLRMLLKISMDTIETTATVLFIVAAASIFAWVLTTTQVTEAVAQWVLSISSEPWVFLLLANLFLLFVGCFMETIAAITILVPVFMPILAKLGIDPIHFGLIMVLNLMIGLITPPVGIVIFVLSKISGLSFERTVVAIVPWMIPLLVTLALITYVPDLVMWLPGILYPD
jgi:tripartite ATP-independent transporter DctM subunit